MRFRAFLLAFFLVQLAACQDLSSERNVQLAQLARDADGAYRELDFDAAANISGMLTAEERADSGVYIDLLLALRRYRNTRSELDFESLEDEAASHLDLSTRLGLNEARNANTSVAMIMMAAYEVKSDSHEIAGKVCEEALAECSCRKALLAELSRGTDMDFLAAEVGFYLSENSMNECPSDSAELLGYRDALGFERGFVNFVSSESQVLHLARDLSYARSFCHVYNGMVSPSSSTLNEFVLRSEVIRATCGKEDMNNSATFGENRSSVQE